MIKYFINRLIRRKLFYLSMAISCALSITYVICDVILPGQLYKETVYTKWIESFSPSELQALFFLMVPIFSAIAMSDVYLSDKNSGYLDVILSKVSKNKYFATLFGCNFVISGLCVLFPLLLNLYMCFLVCPDRNPDLIAEGTNIINIYGNSTLFPTLYYDHPLIHTSIYLFLGFIVSATFGTLGLCLSFFVKSKVIVWIAPYIVNYLYISIVSVAAGSTTKYSLISISMQNGGQTTLSSALCVLALWIVAVTLVYVIGVKKHVRL